jgi:membrane protein required for colicin V production
MTIYDATMAGLVVAGMIWGAWRGIIWQLASISSLVVGYLVAHQVSPQVAVHFPGEPVVARAQAMLAIYAAVSGGIFLVAWMLRSTLRQLRFLAFDRHLGMLMGGLEGALLGLVGTLFVVSMDPQTRTPIFASPTGRVVCQVMNQVGPVLPSEAREVLAPFWNNTSGAAVADSGGTVPQTQSQSQAQAQTEATPSQPPVSPGDSPTSSSSTTAKLESLIEQGESRLGRAIVETAEKGLQQPGGGNDRTLERR